MVPFTNADLVQYPSIKNAPLPADGAGGESFSYPVFLSLLAGVPLYLAWKVGGGLKTTVFFALFTSLPILSAYWMLVSSVSPRLNEKARFPGRPIEHYLTFKKPADKAKYHGRTKIPMETFHEMYFDGDVEFNGDCLEVMEYRHDWASFRFTVSLIRYFLFSMIPEVIMHSRSQGTSLHGLALRFTLIRETGLTGCFLQTRNRSATTTTAVMTSTAGSWAPVWSTLPASLGTSTRRRPWSSFRITNSPLCVRKSA